MPFIGPSAQDPRAWHQIRSVDLRQKPETSPRTIHFEVLGEFGYTSKAPEPGSAVPVWRRSAVEHLVPRGMETDLATVPSFLWGVVASYGRQTLPAILHDMLCYASALPEQPPAYRRNARRLADALFRTTLADSGSGVVRRWIMWTGVRLGGRSSVSLALTGTLVLGVLALVLPWQGPLALAAAAALIGLLALVTAASRESVRRAAPDGPGAAATREHEYSPPRLDARALRSLLGAIGLAVLITPLLLPVTVITLATERVLRIGEKRLPPGLPSTAHAAPDLVDGGATARIQWAPLQAAPERQHHPPE